MLTGRNITRCNFLAGSNGFPGDDRLALQSGGANDVDPGDEQVVITIKTNSLAVDGQACVGACLLRMVYGHGNFLCARMLRGARKLNGGRGVHDRFVFMEKR